MSNTSAEGVTDEDVRVSPQPASAEINEQERTLIAAVLEVAAKSTSLRGQPITIHQPEAEYLLQIPHDLTLDIADLATRRVQMRGHTYMQMDDLEWAMTRMVVGKRSSPWIFVSGTVGGLLAGVAFPIVLEPVIQGTPATTSGILWGFGLLAIGLVSVTASIITSFFRRG